VSASRDPATLARAAVVVASCIPDDGINRNLAYMWTQPGGPRVWHRFAYAAECLASFGQGCGAVEACLGWSIVESLGDCTPECDGAVFSACEETWRFTVDCSKVGLGCDLDAMCSSEPSESCEEGTFVRTCGDDGQPVFCNDGAVFRGPDCATHGLTCSAGYCAGTGADCQGEYPDFQGGVYFDGSACDEDELTACVAGKIATRDCSSAGPGFGCQDVNGVQFCGLASECLPGEEPGASDQSGSPISCEGDTVVFCNAGRIDRVDCTSLGFTGCDVDASQGCTP
jgi:hypothetical protein